MLTSYKEQSTTDIWKCICTAVRRTLSETSIDPTDIRGIGYSATCSLAVFDATSSEPSPITVTNGNFGENKENSQNVILWLDHRAVSETDKINSTGHEVLQYVGGKMSVEMEIPKILWLKNNMPAKLFDRCNFFDLADALTFLSTGKDTRSFCSTVCKQGYIPAGVSKSGHDGWQKDFFEQVGLEDLGKDGFQRIGGVNKLVRISSSNL